MRFIKLAAAIIGAALIILSIAVLPDKICFEGGENYTFYCGTSSADCKIVRADGDAGVKRAFLKNICGESAEFKALNIDEFLNGLSGKILFSESAAGITNYYCSARLPYSVNIDGATVNLQIAVRGDSVKVGSPIIFGGY